MINVGELITDSDFTQPGGVPIERRTEIVANFKRIPGTSEFLNIPGVITIARDDELEMIPEFDRKFGAINVFTNFIIYITENVGNVSYLGDIITFEGNQYKAEKRLNDGQYGFYKTVCVRMRRD